LGHTHTHIHSRPRRTCEEGQVGKTESELSWLGNVLPDKKVIDEAKAKVMVELPLSNAVVVHRKGPTTMSVVVCCVVVGWMANFVLACT